MSQADFGSTHSIGNQGAVWQYLNARIALNAETATKFARGLGIEVGDFSPSLAAEIAALSRPTKRPQAGHSVHQNVEPYLAKQHTLDRVQLMADYDALPADLQAVVARKASEFRSYFEALPPTVRKNFNRPGDPNKFLEWERGIEADIAGIEQKDLKAFLVEQQGAQLEALPPPIQKIVKTAQREVDKHQIKDGPRWVFVLVPDEQRG